MPHKCTRCKEVFGAGIDLLKGCPSCGGKKFEFVSDGPGAGKGRKREPWPANHPDESTIEGYVSGETVINQAMGVKVPPGPRRADTTRASRFEERAEKAREEIAAFREVPVHKPENSLKDDDADKVESVRIFEPGTYELNLPSLFEREELVMSVKEGTYLIDLTTAFKKTKKD